MTKAGITSVSLIQKQFSWSPDSPRLILYSQQEKDILCGLTYLWNIKIKKKKADKSHSGLWLSGCQRQGIAGGENGWRCSNGFAFVAV